MKSVYVGLHLGNNVDVSDFLINIRMDKEVNLFNPMEVIFDDESIKENLKAEKEGEYKEFEEPAEIPQLYNPCSDMSDSKWVCNKASNELRSVEAFDSLDMPVLLYAIDV